jgi:four helix bundle protein
MNKKKPFDLRQRTFEFSAAALKLCRSLATGNEIGNIRRQLSRAATSVGANYRAALRSKSTRDFIAKLGTVEEEADECIFWLDLLKASDSEPGPAIEDLRAEANELLAITVASRKTARAKLQSANSEVRSAK